MSKRIYYKSKTTGEWGLWISAWASNAVDPDLVAEFKRTVKDFSEYHVVSTDQIPDDHWDCWYWSDDKKKICVDIEKASQKFCADQIGMAKSLYKRNVFPYLGCYEVCGGPIKPDDLKGIMKGIFGILQSTEWTIHCTSTDEFEKYSLSALWKKLAPESIHNWL